MNSLSLKTGNIAMIIYALITALSSILIHDTTQIISPILSSFYTFLFCILVYNIVSIAKNKKIPRINTSFTSILMLNITTAICWIFTFYCLKYISAELYLFIYLCSMTISSSWYYRSKLIKASALIIGLILLTSTYNDTELLLGVTLAALGGISGMIYSVFSKKVVSEYSTLDILSLRFYLIIILTFILNFHTGNIQLLDLHYYLRFALLSFISVIIPLTLFQVGIKNLKVNHALSYLPFAPLLCYLFNFIFGNTQFILMQFIAVLLLTITMLF